jgi:ribosomal protein S18 acetylase RimI-like enzyme
MSRTPVSLRQATLEDTVFLTDLWRDALRRADPQEQATDLELIIKSCEDSPERRLVIAQYDAEPAGAVLLTVSTLSPLNLEPTVHMIAPFVAPGFRRRGIGHTLMDAAVTYAEELGIGHVLTAAAYSARSSNRFMARLALGPQAVLRVAATREVRTKLTAQLPAKVRPAGARPMGQVLAVRRSLRRQHPATRELEAALRDKGAGDA